MGAKVRANLATCDLQVSHWIRFSGIQFYEVRLPGSPAESKSTCLMGAMAHIAMHLADIVMHCPAAHTDSSSIQKFEQPCLGCVVEAASCGSGHHSHTQR